MTLQEQITNNLKKAMKAKDTNKLSTLRMLQAAIKNKQIALRQVQGKNQELNDNEVGQIILKEIKQRKDSIKQYTQGGREELAKKEEKEIEVLKDYMPEQLPEEKIKKIIKEAIKKVNAEGPQDMGRVMGIIMPKLKGKTEGSTVSKLVKDSLSNL